MDLDMDISAEQWKGLREAKGWTQMQLATYAGLSSQAVVSNVERGLRPGPGIERRLREVLTPATDGPVPDESPAEAAAAS
jgi:transcriptional regulator with XRE-family HTH domain